MRKYEKKYSNLGFVNIAGSDEVGRGCIAGPIVCAAVILPVGYKNKNIRDSKQLTQKQREILFNEILNDCIDYQIEIIDATTIDQINPKQASILGMENCIKNMKTKPDMVFVDFEKINCDSPTLSITKGDEKSISIAAASIIAKVTRDNIMKDLTITYPNFSFDKHKGYLTKKHLNELKMYKPIKNIHRFSYKPINTNKY